MREGAPIEGFDESPAPITPMKRRGAPKGGWPKKEAAAVRPPITVANEETIRPPVRKDSVREAEEYAHSVMNTLGERIDDTDEFYIPPEVIPEGWSWEWKAHEITGKPNEYHIVDLNRKGWRAVNIEDHPGLRQYMPPGHKGAIHKKGLLLMELPKILTDRAQMKHILESREVLRNSDRKLRESPAGTAPRDEFPEQYRKLNREMVRPGRGPIEE